MWDAAADAVDERESVAALDADSEGVLVAALVVVGVSVCVDVRVPDCVAGGVADAEAVPEAEKLDDAVCAESG